MKPEAIILSPGPGRPEDAGICIPVIKEFAGKIPILGVCLGHQSICEAFGGTVSYAKELIVLIEVSKLMPEAEQQAIQKLVEQQS